MRIYKYFNLFKVNKYEQSICAIQNIGATQRSFNSTCCRVFDPLTNYGWLIYEYVNLACIHNKKQMLHISKAVGEGHGDVVLTLCFNTIGFPKLT